MIPAPPPITEADRIRRLMGLGMLDASRDPVLDALAHRALLLFPGTDSAAISLVASNRVWFKACAGRVWQTAPRKDSFCAHAILDDRVTVVEDAWRDERFHDHPMVVGEPHIRFYAAAPLMDQVGLVCVLGLYPRVISKLAIDTLTTLAHTASQRLELHRAVRELTLQIPLTGRPVKECRLTRELLAGLRHR